MTKYSSLHNSQYNWLIKYILIAISSIALLNCGGSSSGTTVPNAEPVPSGKYYKFQNGVVEGVDFETNSGKTGSVSSDKGFTYNVGDEKVTFKIKDLIIGTFDITKLKDGETLLVSDIVGVERDDTVNKDVLKMLRVLHSLDRDNKPSNGILIDDTTKNLLVGLSEDKTKITENDIYELKALMVKAGKTLVVEKKARDYYKENVLKPLKITYKFNPFTIEVDIPSTDKTFTFQAPRIGGDGYDYTIDWGDGSDIEENVTEEKIHTYANAGTYTIKVSGKFPYLLLSSSEKAKITQVLAWGDVAWITFNSVFQGMNVKFSTTDTPDLSEVKNVTNMFSGLKTANIDFIEDWDVSKVTNMTTMFSHATSFNGNISSWDVSNVTNMGIMFNGASSFNQDLSGWDVSNVTNMEIMFSGASSFNQDLSKWTVSQVTEFGGFATEWGGSVDDIPPKFR